MNAMTITKFQDDELTRLDKLRAQSLDRERHDFTWYLLRTNPKCELRVERGLVEAGFCAYTPEGRKWVKPRRAHAHVVRNIPAYCRYVFVAFPQRADWFTVRQTDGVEAVICNEGAPIRIPAIDIARVRAAQDLGLFDFNEAPRPKWEKGLYQRGNLVRLKDGPMTGFVATVIRPSSAKEVEIETMLFGRKTLSRVKLEFVEMMADG